MESKKKPAGFAAAWLAVCALCLPLLLGSCGSDEYEKPALTNTPAALISAATLKSWMDAGAVNATGYNRVVILDVTTQAMYDAAHIPGAHFFNSADISQSRLDGLTLLSTEVPEGARMDALIQRYGIDGNTTIVFTGTPSTGPGPAFITRAYFAFRYWGFPKSRLKVMDGGNIGWSAAGYTFTNIPAPAPTASKFSVTDNARLRDDLRISLPEMIEYAEGRVPGALAVDARSSNTSGSYAGTAGSTTGVYLPGTGAAGSATNDHTVFEGKINGAQAILFSGMYNAATHATAPFHFLDSSALTAQLTAIGLDTTRTAYVYCRIGVLGSGLFFVLDGILGWPAALYDGSWQEWGQLSDDTANKGQLTAGSPWKTDVAGRSAAITYNWTAFNVEQFTVDGTACSSMYIKTSGAILNSWGGPTACTNLPNSFETNVNRIEKADRAYMSTGGLSGGGSGGSGGGGGTIPSGC